MAASVLNTERAVEMSVFIVRAFVKMRQAITEHRELSSKLTRLEHHLAEHDKKILFLVEAIKQLMKPSEVPKKRRIGFQKDKP